MKNVTFLLLFAVAFLVGKESFAQKTLESGSISMKMEIESDDPQAQAQMEMMGDITMDILFREGKSRTNMNMGGGLMSMSTILDTKANEGLTLQSMMGQRMAAKLDKEKVEGQINANTELSEDVEIIETTETVKILGYKCKKYIMKGVQGTTEPILLYVTDAFKIPASQVQSQYSRGIKGFPLRIVMEGPQGSMTLEATEVSKEAPAAELFDLTIPEGYTEVEPEDLPGGGM